MEIGVCRISGRRQESRSAAVSLIAELGISIRRDNSAGKSVARGNAVASISAPHPEWKSGAIFPIRET